MNGLDDFAGFAGIPARLVAPLATSAAFFGDLIWLSFLDFALQLNDPPKGVMTVYS